MVLSSDYENTGVKRPGRTDSVKMGSIMKNIRAEEVLKLHKTLVRLKIGTGKVERAAESIKAEGFNKERLINETLKLNLEFAYTSVNGEWVLNEVSDGTRTCKRDNEVVRDLMIIEERECRKHRNKMKKMARDEKTRIEAKASQQGRDRLKQVQKEIREEVTKLRKELREQHTKKVENLMRRSKDCKYHKLCKAEHKYEDEIRKLLHEKVKLKQGEMVGGRRERVTHRPKTCPKRNHRRGLYRSGGVWWMGQMVKGQMRERNYITIKPQEFQRYWRTYGKKRKRCSRT